MMSYVHISGNGSIDLFGTVSSGKNYVEDGDKQSDEQIPLSSFRDAMFPLYHEQSRYGQEDQRSGKYFLLVWY